MLHTPKAEQQNKHRHGEPKAGKPGSRPPKTVHKNTKRNRKNCMRTAEKLSTQSVKILCAEKKNSLRTAQKF